MDFKNNLVRLYFKSHDTLTKELIRRGAEIRIRSISSPDLCYSPTILNPQEKNLNTITLF